MSVVLGLNERALIAAIIKVLARDFSDGRGHPTHHDYMSTFENVCDVLWKCGAAIPTDRDGKNLSDHKMFPAYFLIAEPDEAVRCLALQDPENLPPIEEIIDAAIDYLASHTSHLPSSRKAFSVEEPYTDLMDQFTRSGYARKRGTAYLWTEKVANFMEGHNEWDKDGRSVYDGWQEKRARKITVQENAVAQAMRSKPQVLDQWLSTIPHPLAVFLLLCRAWDGIRWQKVETAIAEAELAMSTIPRWVLPDLANEHRQEALFSLISYYWNGKEWSLPEDGNDWISSRDWPYPDHIWTLHKLLVKR